MAEAAGRSARRAPAATPTPPHTAAGARGCFAVGEEVGRREVCVLCGHTPLLPLILWVQLVALKLGRVLLLRPLIHLLLLVLVE